MRNASAGEARGIVLSAGSAGPFRSWAASHPGAVRSLNEDAFVNRPDLGLWAVADGVGGHAHGDAASRMIADALSSVEAGLSAQDLLAEVRARMLNVHAQLRLRADEAGDSVVASTLVVLLAREGHLACLWAGDSRAYLLRGSEFRQITRDHSLVQSLLDSGALAPSQAERYPYAHVITRAVGARDEALDLDKVTEPLQPADRLLLCTDGLFKALPESEVAALLGSGEASPAERLLIAALDRQASDNVTTLVLQVSAEDADIQP